MKKINFLICLILVSFVFFQPIISAEKSIDDVVKDLVINIDGTDILRSGNEIIIRPTIINNNTNESIEIKQINFLTLTKKEVKNINLNKNIKAIKNEFKEIKEIYKEQHTTNRPELTPRYSELVALVQQGIFAKGFVLDIREFDSSLDIGEKILIPIEIHIKYNNKNYVIEENYTVLISEPLPNPPHNSPGWYKGDQHVHSEWSENPIDGYNIPPISEMVVGAKAKNLEWIIATDHSDSDFMNSNNWATANSECNNEDISSFECVYGQELALGTEDQYDFCDRQHYLAYDSTPSYINAQCVCFCEDAQDKIDELNNNGGYGFIAHPYTTESIINWEDWDVTGFTGLELINGEWSDDDATTISNYGGDDDSWVEFLDAETNPVNGFAVGIGNSDAHSITSLGNTTIYCYMDSLSQVNVVNAIKDGKCIASIGPFVEFTLNNDDAIIGETADACASTNNVVHVSASSIAEFGQLYRVSVYTNGETFKGSELLSDYSDSVDIPITLDAGDSYVRVVVETTLDRYAYTNPIWLNIGTTDADSDNYCSYVDCNEGNANVNPGEIETCGNSIDDDCDGSTDEGCESPEGVSACDYEDGLDGDCPSNYEAVGSYPNCYWSGGNWECELTCWRDEYCGSYGGWNSESKLCLSEQSGSWCDTDPVYENSNYCYQFYTDTEVNPSLGPSISATAMTDWDTESSACTSSRPVSASTSTYPHGKGVNGNDHFGSGKWTLCSGSLSSTSVNVDFYYRTASWYDEDYDYSYCDVPYTSDINIDNYIYGNINASCYVEVIGDESSPNKIRAKWYVNGDYAGTQNCEDNECADDVGSTWSNTFTLDNSKYSKGDEVYCIGRGYGEDEGYGVYVQSDEIIVSNSAPTMLSISLDKSIVMEGENIIVTANSEADIDSDVLAMYCCNGISCTPSNSNHDFCYVSGDSPPYNLQCTGQGLGGDETKTIKCRTYDGEDYSTIKSNTYTADNTIPDAEIISPLEQTYWVSLIDFNISLNENGNCQYSLDSGITNISMSSVDNQNFGATNTSIGGGNYVVNFYCEDNAGNINNTESVSFSIDAIIIPNDTYKFYIKDSLGENVAWLGDAGNIVLAGTCTSGGTCTASDGDSFIFKDLGGNEVAYIDGSGNLCIEDSDCNYGDASCIPSNDAFILKDSGGTNKIYVDFTDGELCLTGTLYQNSNP